MRVLVPVLLVALGCAPFLGACGENGRADGANRSGGASAASESAPVAVRAAPVVRASWERSVPAIGELRPEERVVVATKVPGRLAELAVDRGQRVRRGELVAALESREYELRVRAAEAAVSVTRAQLGLASEGDDDAVDPEASALVRFARAELERARLARERTLQLAREGVDSKAVSDQAEADFRAAESRLQEAFEQVAARRAELAEGRAELEIARAQLDETRIEAPFDGVVAARLTATGAYLATGAPVAELVRVDPLRLVLEVAERDAARVRPGQTVRVRLAGIADELAGVVDRIAPALAADSRTLAVEADLPNPEGALRAGAFADARIVVAPDEDALAVPLAAVVSFAGLDKVFVVRAGVVEERRVTLGRRADDRAEVLAGLEEGEAVVLEPGKLRSGARVRVEE
jgi:RND family efflux transporter MFP subunit